MAVIAGVACRDVIAGLAGCGAAVVAGDTGAGDRGVIKADIAPAGGLMTIVAGIAAGDVIAGLASGGVAVVAGGTGSGD